MYKDIQDKIITDVLISEGWDTYTNDPDDLGGKTKWGVTEKTAHAMGYVGCVKNMTKEEAVHIYQILFYRPLRIDDLLELYHSLAYQVFDFGVNAGVNRASVILQRVLNVLSNNNKHFLKLKEDGILGSKTLKALNLLAKTRSNSLELINNKYYALRDTYYTELAEKKPAQQKFIYGWSKRALLARKWSV